MTLRLFWVVALQEYESYEITQNLGVKNLRFRFTKKLSDKKLDKNYIYTFELK
jgi:hypothetical protein